MSMTIAPSGAALPGAAPTTMPPTTASPYVAAQPASIPSILQPASGVSGGGPSAELQAAIEGLWGALGALKGALASLQALQQQGVAGGGGSGGCACHQAMAGATPMVPVDQLMGGADGGGPAAAAAPASAPAAPAAAASSWKAPKGTKIKNPLPGARESSHFGEVSSIRKNRPHSGLDLATGAGAAIGAAAKGKVTEVGWDGDGLGRYVVIDHGNGFVTKYGHMLKDSAKVKQGDVVEAGQKIGEVGSTGNSTGPHLHFMVVKDGANQDPKPYVDGKLTFG